ncbi:MAG: hypothetical protein KME16_10560 [Scytolyngbya sp. HA4215-MV1]|nr:hypothetical protein [Scytolyngbya sp. HA4215-MV1]
MNTRSYLQSSSNQNAPLTAQIQQRPWHNPQDEAVQAVESPKGAIADFSHVDLFSHAPVRGTIQAKLTVGEPNDVYEQEENWVAEPVMSIAPPATPHLQRQEEGGLKISSLLQRQANNDLQRQSLVSTLRPFIQRQTAEENAEALQMKCDACATGEETLQRQGIGTPSVGQRLESPLSQTQGIGSFRLPDIKVPSASKTVPNLQKQDDPPVLPGFSQGEGDTCGAASLVTALMIWDQENYNPTVPNLRVVTVCNLVLSYMSQFRQKTIQAWKNLKVISDPEAFFNLQVAALTQLREDARQTGAKLNEAQYLQITRSLYFLHVKGKGGLTSEQIHNIRQLIGLTSSKSETPKTFDDLFSNSIVQGLKPGQIAQVTWATQGDNAGEQGREHAFLIGRLKNGKYFLSESRHQSTYQIASRHY